MRPRAILPVSITLAVQLCCLPCLAETADLPDTHVENQLSAEDVLERVRNALPVVPIRIQAQLQAKTRVGKVEATRQAEMSFNWHAPTPMASYTIQDTFGNDLEKLVMEWPTGEAARYRYYQGEDLQPATLDDLSVQLEGMDYSWSDLTLSFLWWKGGEMVGMAKKKGRLCYVLDVPAPPDVTQAYAGVRLWIDAEVYVLLQAEGYDVEQKRVRQMQVKSFKKIDDMWTIKNLDIQTFPSRHKTTLRVQDLQVVLDSEF